MSPLSPAAPLRASGFIVLWQGQTLSRLGDQAFLIATMLAVQRATDSALSVAIVLLASFLPGIVLGPFAGTLADHWQRKRLLILSDISAGVLVLACAAAISATGCSKWPAIIATTAMIRTIVTLPFGPALGAALPDVLPAEVLPRAYALLAASGQAAALVGQALGSALAQLLGLPMLLAIDALSFLVASAASTALRLPAGLRRQPLPLRIAARRFARDTLDGMRFVWSQSGLRHALMANVVLGLTGIGFFALLPFLVQRSLHAGPSWFGALLAMMGAGSLVGSTIAGGATPDPRQRKRIILAALLAANIPYVCMGFVTTAWQAGVCATASGFLCSLGSPAFEAIVALRTPDTLRGRVSSARGSISAACMPIGLLLSGWCGDHMDVRFVYMIGGAASIMASIALASSTAYRRYLVIE